MIFYLSRVTCNSRVSPLISRGLKICGPRCTIIDSEVSIHQAAVYQSEHTVSIRNPLTATLHTLSYTNIQRRTSRAGEHNVVTTTAQHITHVLPGQNSTATSSAFNAHVNFRYYFVPNSSCRVWCTCKRIGLARCFPGCWLWLYHDSCIVRRESPTCLRAICAV